MGAIGGYRTCDAGDDGVPANRIIDASSSPLGWAVAPAFRAGVFLFQGSTEARPIKVMRLAQNPEQEKWHRLQRHLTAASDCRSLASTEFLRNPLPPCQALSPP